MTSGIACASRHAAQVGVLLSAIFAAVAVTAPAAGAQQWSRTDVEAGRNLLARVPADFRPGCKFDNVRRPGSDTTVVAAVDCSLPSGLAADNLSYTWYETQKDADAAYDALIGHEEDSLQPDGCGLYEGEYTLHGSDEGGRYTCFTSDGSTSIIYTYTPFPVVAVITANVASEADVHAMGDFFDNDAGPLAKPGRIPSLQSQKFGEKAAKALRRHIPAAFRKDCDANGDSFTSPWVAFEYTCITPSPGIEAVRYTSYRDDEGFDAAYDADKFLATHRDEAPSSCDEGTWQVGKKTAGSYVCGVYDGKTYLLWTDERSRIVATAYVNDDQMTTDEFFTWWNDEAGPLG
jgi:hypothetical protein